MKCPSCGFENEADVKFCGNCGVKLPETIAAPEKNIFCSNCGQENPPGSRFCQDCGSEILRPGAASHAGLPPPWQVGTVTAPARPGSRIPGWAWMLAGIAVILVAVGVLYLLRTKPSDTIAAETIIAETEVAVSALPAAQAPSTCWSEEDIFYSEDFQDGAAQNWPGFSQQPSLFSIGPGPDDARNLVLTVQKPAAASGQMQAGPQLNVDRFSNAALRIRFYIAGRLPAGDNDWFSFNWLFVDQPFTLNGQQVYDSRYQLPIGWNYFEMRRLQQPVTNVSVDRSINPTSDEWHLLEIATYQPRTEVWLDGTRVMGYEDPNPLPEGTFGLEVWLADPQVKLLFDDIVICELDGPYQP